MCTNQPLYNFSDLLFANIPAESTSYAPTFFGQDWPGSFREDVNGYITEYTKTGVLLISSFIKDVGFEKRRFFVCFRLKGL